MLCGSEGFNVRSVIFGRKIFKAFPSNCAVVPCAVYRETNTIILLVEMLSASRVLPAYPIARRKDLVPNSNLCKCTMSLTTASTMWQLSAPRIITVRSFFLPLEAVYMELDAFLFNFKGSDNLPMLSLIASATIFRLFLKIVSALDAYRHSTLKTHTTCSSRGLNSNVMCLSLVVDVYLYVHLIFR